MQDDRRLWLGAATAVTLAALSSGSHAQSDPHAHHHDHGGHDAGGRYGLLAQSAAACVAKGQVCLAHCLVLLGDGDKSMAGCAQGVNQMMALCTAVQNLASQGSRLTPAAARLALDACTECEKECRRHADQHMQCKECAQACVECIKQCKALAS